jgi:uncharacterized protein (DUF1778 family)
MARTERIELRAEPEEEARIRLAASLTHKSMTSFVLEAAAERAEQTIAQAATTVVPADFFDTLYKALDAPPVPNVALARAAKRSRRVTQA